MSGLIVDSFDQSVWWPMPLAALMSLVMLVARSDVRVRHVVAATQPTLATTVLGVVYDSLAMRALGRARVQMTDATNTWMRTVETDSAGAFRIDDVPAGTYLLGFLHPKLDSLSLASPTLRIGVRTEQPIHVRLAIPSARTIIRLLCGAKALTDSTGVLIGYLRSAETSNPLPAGSLNVRWAEFVIEKGAMRRYAPAADVSSGASGSFVLCGLPIGASVLIQASSATEKSGSFEVTIPASGLLYRDVFVAPVKRVTMTVADSASAIEVWRGTGRLRGQIMAATGRPIFGARVSVWGTGLETTTNSDGQFALEALPGGTQTLDVRAVGFLPAQLAVDLVTGVGGETDVELANLGIRLDTIRVVAPGVTMPGQDADFLRRMKLRSGTGHFFDSKEIESRNISQLTDLIRAIPGVQILPTRRGDPAPYMRGGAGILGSGRCRPVLWVDGARVQNDEDFKFDAIVSITDVRAVEVYPHAPLVPVEFQTLSGCGAIVIWTGTRRRN